MIKMINWDVEWLVFKLGLPWITNFAAAYQKACFLIIKRADTYKILSSKPYKTRNHEYSFHSPKSETYILIPKKGDQKTKMIAINTKIKIF